MLGQSYKHSLQGAKLLFLKAIAMTLDLLMSFKDGICIRI